MKNYNFCNDVKLIRQCFGMTQMEFAKEVGLSRSNIARYDANQIIPRKDAIEKIYNYSFSHGFDLNKAKSMIYEDNKGKKAILFHGAKNDKNEMNGEPDTKHSTPPNDFGNGFYLGQTLTQANMWICPYHNSSTYCFYFDYTALKKMEFDVDYSWMYIILYYRGELDEYELPKELIKLIDQVERVDYIIAPIADNQMYDTIEAFRNNLISDVACLHALNANNLGKQFVFKSEKSCKKLETVDRFYLCSKEKEYYLSLKYNSSLDGKNKISLAIAKYRKEGRMFNEIFKKKR